MKIICKYASCRKPVVGTAVVVGEFAHSNPMDIPSGVYHPGCKWDAEAAPILAANAIALAERDAEIEKRLQF